MIVIRIISQISSAMVAANLLLSFYLIMRLQNRFSRHYIWIVILLGIQIFAPQTAVLFLTDNFTRIMDYQHLLLIAYMILSVTLPILLFLLVKIYQILIKDDMKPWLLSINLLMIAGAFSVVLVQIFLIKDINLQFRISVVHLLVSSSFYTLLSWMSFFHYLVSLRHRLNPDQKIYSLAGIVYLFLFAPFYLIYTIKDLGLYFRINDLTAYIHYLVENYVSQGRPGPYIFPYIAHNAAHILSIILLAKYLFGQSYNLEYKIEQIFARHYKLSVRETEICIQILKDVPNKQIAQDLYMAEGTLKNHISNIFRKCRVRTRTELRKLFKEEHGSQEI